MPERKLGKRGFITIKLLLGLFYQRISSRANISISGWLGGLFLPQPVTDSRFGNQKPRTGWIRFDFVSEVAYIDV